jgi:hypothetical protein
VPPLLRLGDEYTGDDERYRHISAPVPLSAYMNPSTHPKYTTSLAVTAGDE